MLIEYKFQSRDGRIIEGYATSFDRDYDDEETAMIFIDNPCHKDTEGYFELNIRKDDNGKALNEGYVCEYDSIDDSDYSYINENVEIQVVYHDFDEGLELANAELQDSGLELVVSYDDDCNWSIGVKSNETEKVVWYVYGDFENEVKNDIYEAWAVAKDIIKRSQTNNNEENNDSLYIITYVGLSDSEYDANGYSECRVAKSLNEARQKLKEWRDNEIQCLKDEDRDFKILEDEADKCRISWCGYDEQIRLEIHKIEQN